MNGRAQRLMGPFMTALKPLAEQHASPALVRILVNHAAANPLKYHDPDNATLKNEAGAILALLDVDPSVRDRVEGAALPLFRQHLLTEHRAEMVRWMGQTLIRTDSSEEVLETAIARLVQCATKSGTDERDHINKILVDIPVRGRRTPVQVDRHRLRRLGMMCS